MSRTPQQHRSPKTPGMADWDRFTARLPRDLNDALQQRARRHGRSANAELVAILERVLTSPDPRTIAAAHVAGTTPAHTH